MLDSLHKLIVYGEREGTFAAKANKDLAQAACLLAALKLHRAWEVEEAWEDLAGRGKGWLDRARHGLLPSIPCSCWRFEARERRGMHGHI